MRSLSFWLLIIISFFSHSRISAHTDPPKKQYNAIRSSSPIKIDGVLDEPIWSTSPIATDFIQNQPDPGEAPAAKTEVRVIYDDVSLYISAYLHDDEPDKILKELSQRDDLGNTDWFGIYLDPYRDGINGVSFIVTPRNVQVDAKYSAVEGQDDSWDAVWESATQIVSDGWIVELQIPYSAIRFPEKNEQLWHINFGRSIRRIRQTSYWNEVKPNIDGFLNQSGLIGGIKDIKPPVRLQAIPFVTTIIENYYDKNNTPKSSWGSSFGGGMDVKYGITDAFTLDMTLIPDFSQAQSDNEILNLSPFEVRFDENRQFFTEGVELFNKGNLFYSRRVGGRPFYRSRVSQLRNKGYDVIDNPQNAQLLNASKISGRTSSGLGIGLFNATEGKTRAELRTPEGQDTSVLVSPLTNYNLFVLDQNLKNNSYVTLVNTNVMRGGAAYDANVTGTFFNIRDKTNTYAIEGSGVLTQKFFSDSENGYNVDLGHRYYLELAKISGNFQFSGGFGEESYNYDPNDLGFLTAPNERFFYGSARYITFKPFWILNRLRTSLNVNYTRLHRPNEFSNFAINYEINFLTKKWFFIEFWTTLRPVQTRDYFEPRTSDFSQFYAFPKNYSVGFWLSTDYRKVFAIDANASYRTFDEIGRSQINIGVEPRVRVSDQFNFRFEFSNRRLFNDIGFVSRDENNIFFGRRDQIIVENILNANYTFNSNIALTFRMRHYWTLVEYDRYNSLGANGELLNTDYAGNHNSKFDAFNIDMIFRWRFAPGSDIFVVWKNSILEGQSLDPSLEYNRNYFQNVDDVFDLPQLNSLSIKVLYFIDYLYFKNKS